VPYTGIRERERARLGRVGAKERVAGTLGSLVAPQPPLRIARSCSTNHLLEIAVCPLIDFASFVLRDVRFQLEEFKWTSRVSFFTCHHRVIWSTPSSIPILIANWLRHPSSRKPGAYGWSYVQGPDR
jgi:hypothetical protein